MYVTDCGQLAYERTHQGSFNTLKAGSIEPFLSWVKTKIRIDKWSLDAAVGYALRKGLFVRNEMVCKTITPLYPKRNAHKGCVRRNDSAGVKLVQQFTPKAVGLPNASRSLH